MVGLTGGIAAGKTSVSRLLAERGAHIIDADSVGHRVIAPGGGAFAEVVAAFGEDILGADGAIDRRKLGALVFADAAQLERLNGISHPRMAELMGREIAALRELPASQAPPLIVLDAAILLEAGWDVLCDEVWAVVAGEEVAVARLMERDGFSRDEALARLGAQMSNEERTARAARVIRNEGDLDALGAQVAEIWDEVTS